MKRVAKYLSVAAIAFLIGASVFYARYQIRSDAIAIRHNLSRPAANALKHALAAADLFDGLNHILPDDAAADTVYRLGVINEHIERVTKFRSPDSAREMMKDLYNNAVGVAAARHHKMAASAAREAQIVALIGNKTLIISRHDNPFFNGEATAEQGNADFAAAWFESHREKILARADAGLAAIDRVSP